MQKNLLGIVLLTIGLVAFSLIVMAQFETERFYQGIVAGLIPSLALFVASSIKEAPAEKSSELRAAFVQGNAKILFISLIFLQLVLWGLQLAWFTSFQDLEARLIADQEITGISQYADHAFQKSVAGMLALSSWFPLTMMACLLLGILFGRLHFWLIALANLISICSYVLVVELTEFLDGGTSIETMFATMFQGSLHESSMIAWDRIALMIMAGGAGFVLLLLFTAIMSVSISTGARFGRRSHLS